MDKRDEAFRQWVKQNKEIGYGNMITIVAEEWWKSAIERGDPVSGVFVGYPVGLLPKDAEREMMEEMEHRTGMKPNNKVECEECEGFGEKPAARWSDDGTGDTCHVCGGTGWIQEGWGEYNMDGIPCLACEE